MMALVESKRFWSGSATPGSLGCHCGSAFSVCVMDTSGGSQAWQFIFVVPYRLCVVAESPHPLKIAVDVWLVLTDVPFFWVCPCLAFCWLMPSKKKVFSSWPQCQLVLVFRAHHGARRCSHVKMFDVAARGTLSAVNPIISFGGVHGLWLPLHCCHPVLSPKLIPRSSSQLAASFRPKTFSLSGVRCLRWSIQ